MGKTIYHAKQDPVYQRPFTDTDENRIRTLSDGSVLSYRYIHGGFLGTDVKFSFCFPKKENFLGRFYQYLSPFPGPNEETASLEKIGEDDIIAFALSNGAYYVESNMGSKMMFGINSDSTIVYKSSAAVAEYSKIKACEIYGCDRPFGYVFGGSGGGYKTMACIENTDAWDGAVPYVIGSPVSLPNTITMHAQGRRCLRNAFSKIVDALDAGGNGDPYCGLNEDEAFTLREITAMGFSPQIWFAEANGQGGDGSLPVLAPMVKRLDPEYFEDFWKVPGYLGADPKSSAVQDRLRFHGIVRRVHIPGEVTETNETDDRNGVDTAWQKLIADGNGGWIELEDIPKGNDLYLSGVNIYIETGAAAGKTMMLKDIVGNCLTVSSDVGADNLREVISMIQPGDEVFLDNSDYIAIQSYYRHQVPSDLSFKAWDQFRDKQGKPVLPQRKNVMGYRMTGTGTVQDGNIQGKVIVIQALMDEGTCPWCADWYRNKIIDAKGSEQDFRLYYMERCMHGDTSWMENNMITNYLGALRQALLDLSDWVEKGIQPPETTVYKYEKGQITVPETAALRKGIQPTVKLLANGQSCAKVNAGEKVLFTAAAQVPFGAGQVTAMDFDFEDNRNIPGGQSFPVKGTVYQTEIDGLPSATAAAEHSFNICGTYFVSVRVKANRKGDANDIFTQVKNIARVRVIVCE